METWTWILLLLACDRMRLYHNPRCSKSRQAVALLTEAGYEFEVYLYLLDGIAPEDQEALASIEGIIRSNDVIGNLDLSNLSLIEIHVSNAKPNTFIYIYIYVYICVRFTF